MIYISNPSVLCTYSRFPNPQAKVYQIQDQGSGSGYSDDYHGTTSRVKVIKDPDTRVSLYDEQYHNLQAKP